MEEVRPSPAMGARPTSVARTPFWRRRQFWRAALPAAAVESVRLDPAVRPLVRRFVATAVARKDLAAAYAISGPAIRQGETLAQFAAGSIPVVPYAIDATSSVTFLRVDESQPASARLEVFLATPDRAVNSPHTFFVDLIKRRGRWYVNGWTPRWTPPIPTLP